MADQSPTPTAPGAAAPPRKFSYRDLVESWRAEYPGEFDSFDNADLADAILAEVPEFRSVVDESTKGTESVPPPNLGGFERGPKLPTPPTAKEISETTLPTNPLRQASLGDMAVEAGLVAVPSLLGATIGSSVPGYGTAIGGFAGGAFGETLREGYQNWARTRNDGISLPNVVLQGGINAALPGVTKVGGKALEALAPQLVERVAPPVARVAGSMAEGALASGSSTAAERVVRDHDLPSLEELGTSAVLGSGFGAAMGLGAEVVNAIKAGQAVPEPAQVQALFAKLADQATRNEAAQAIYDLATTVGKNNPTAGAQLLQQLVEEANLHVQADLQQFAGAFVQDFGRRADSLTMDGQASEINAFLDGLKQRGATQQLLGNVRQILTDIRDTSAPRPFDQPSEQGWYTELQPGALHGPEAGTPTTPAEAKFASAFDQALEQPPVERNAPPMYDPSAAGEPGFTAREVLPRQQSLKMQEGNPPMAPGPNLAVPPTLQAVGVDAQPGVQRGVVSRDSALFLHWFANDLTNFQFVPGSRMEGQAALDVMGAASSQEAGRQAVYDPRQAGSPLYHAIKRLAGDVDTVGAGGSRRVIAQQIDNLLSGKARRPGKYALAAERLSKLYQAAWVPGENRLDWSRVSDEQLTEAGWKGSRRELRQLTPASPLSFYAEGQPADLVDRFLPGERARRAADLESASAPPLERPEDVAPDEMAQARQLVRGASNEHLLQLYKDLTEFKAGQENLEAPEEFGGAWYDVGPGLIAAELERRGLGKYTQPELPATGPGTPGELGVKRAATPLQDAESARAMEHKRTEGAPLYDQLQAIQGRRELLIEQGRGGTPEYLDLLREENRLGDALEAERGTAGAESQPALLPEVRTTERAQPLLMNEADLFSLTPEPAEPMTPARAKALQRPLFGDETGAVGKIKDVKMQREAALRDVSISANDMQDLKDTVESAGGEEVAGLLIGDADGQIRHVLLSDNRAADPTKTFEIGADVVQRAQFYARQRGWDVLASFHSQPTGSAEPSKRDLKGTVADLPMMILGVRGNSLRDVKIWQPSGTRTAPWLEGNVTIADAPVVPATGVPPKVASWMVEQIPKFTGAPGDTPALTDYLNAHKAEFGSYPWYVRAQQFLDEGNPRQAWIEVQAASVATQKAARATVQASPLADAARDALVARVEQATAAGPQDPIGALFALYDGRTTWVDGVGRIVVAPEIPPALKGKGVSAGPGGILQPGQADIPLPSEQQVVSMTVDALNDVLKDVNAHAILDDPSQASFTRLNRQIAEQLMLRAPSSWGALKAWRTAMKARGISDREINRQIAAHLTKTASESGRFLAALSVWKQRHVGEIRAIEGIKGASGDIEDVMIIGAGGRRIGRLGDLADADTFKDVVQPGRAWDRALLLNDLTRSERGTFDLFEASSRAFMLSQWATAARNFWSINTRWGVEMFDEVASAVANTTLGKPGRALNHLKKAGDMLRYIPLLRPDGWVMPWHARQAQWEQIFDSTSYLASLPMGKERQAALTLLKGVPEEAAHFLGSTAFGEPTPHSVSKYRILNWMAKPSVQNTLTMFNRAQEFTARSGMYVANLKDQLRLKGIDPEVLTQLPVKDIETLVGGQDELRRMLQHSVAGALDFTFSGELIKKGFGKDEFGRPKGAFNAAFVDLINKFPGVRAGYPWPRFNLSAAPRFIWDHSGVNAVIESVNQGLLEHAGVGVQRGRFYLGRKAATYEQSSIPEAQQKFRDAQADLGQQLQVVQSLNREFTIQKRLVARAEKRGLTQQAIEGRQRLESLSQVLEREMDTFTRTEDRMKGLQSQIDTLQQVVDQSKAVRAPETYAELWGRAGAGMASMLVPALMLRAEQQGKGTKWYELRYDIPGLGDRVIDTRPLAPFTQFLFFADVINDLDAHTDWPGVWEDHQSGTPFLDAMYGRYEGKYTSKTLGQQTLNAFLSMSQAAGTTLAVLEQFTNIGDTGFPSLEDLGNTTMTAIGSLLARFTIPFAQFKGLTDLVNPEESHARITSTDQGMMAPLAQPLANLPFVGSAVIPDTYNQLTGQPLSAYLPELRTSLGVTLREWNKVGAEINDTGTPGSAVYIRATHDPFLDRLIGFHYAQAIAQFADPLIFANEYYQGLDSPATKRDYLQSNVFPMLKKYAIGQAMVDVGWKRIQEEREGSEQRRRRLRWERLNALANEEGISFAEGDANDAEPQEPDTDVVPGDAAPAAPEAPRLEDAPQTPQASLRAPGFAEEDRRPALDRALSPRAPAFAG